MAKPDKIKKENVDSENAVEKVETVEEVETAQKTDKVKESKQKENKKDKARKAKKSKENKPNKVKETVAELKKVTWPTFGKVVKGTLLVLGIVLIFTIVLFGIDYGLSWLYKLITPAA